MLVLGGCMGRDAGSDLVISDRRATNDGLGGDAAAYAGASAAALDSAMQDGTTSAIIEGLLNRRSVIEAGPLRNVADATLAANARAAEADLRAAMLRAEARSMNWLPSLGPQISLTSLGAVVTQMLVEQVLFDNGAKRAERDYARADVEVAAVVLAQDTNARVLEAVELYITAEAARSRADVNSAAIERMRHFAYIMGERVNAGISNRADLQVVQQKLDQMQSDLDADRAAMLSALNELQAMSATPVDRIRGLSPIGQPGANAVALSVLKAQAESARALAGARAARAGFLPGLTLGGTIGSGGNNLGLNAAAPNGIGLGTGAALAAIEAEQAAASARVGQETEAAARAIAALQGRLASLRQQAGEADSLARQAAQNYELFAEQQRAGLRQVTDVVGVFETKVRAERAAVDLRHDILRIEARIAARMGTLVDGERI